MERTKKQSLRTDDNIFATYLQEINKIPLLTAEQELSYAKNISIKTFPSWI